MTNKSKTFVARMKIVTPLGIYTGKSDEINNTKVSFQDYVTEVTSLIVDLGKMGGEGVANFTDDQGRVVFIMSETLKNSIVTVEKVG